MCVCLSVCLPVCLHLGTKARLNLCKHNVVFVSQTYYTHLQGRPSPKPMMHTIAYPPISGKFINLPYFRSIYVLLPNLGFLRPPILTIMH